MQKNRFFIFVWFILAVLLTSFPGQTVQAQEQMTESIQTAESEQTSANEQAVESEQTTEAAPLLNGLITASDGNLYYYKDSVMQTGWQTIEGSTYYFKKKDSVAIPKGAAYIGLRRVDGERYYFSRKGKLQTGWKKINGYKYYFSKSGKMVTGLKKIDGKTYYFSVSGKMRTSCWKTVDGYRYYFKSNGVAATGGYRIGSSIYVFRANGRLVQKESSSIVKVLDNYYYVDSSGKAATSQWIDAGSKLCYANENGKLKKNTTYQGITFNSYGYAESNTASNLKLKVMSIVSQITNDSMTQSQKLRACWSYMTGRGWYYYGNYPSSYSTGWQVPIAYSMLSRRGGNCYGFACAFAALAYEIGYDPYLVVGRVSGTRDGAADGLTRHCWVRISGLYYDPEAQWKGWWTGCYGIGSYGITHTVSGIYRFAPPA